MRKPVGNKQYSKLMLAKRDQCCSIAIAIAIVEEIRTQIIIYHDAKPVSCF